MAAKLGVRLYATIAQSALECIIGSNGSALDLFILLGALRGKGKVMAKDCRNVVANYRDHCMQLDECVKPEHYGLPRFQDDDQMLALYGAAALAVSRTRQRPTRTRGAELPVAHNENIGAKYGILADMDLTDLSIIAKAIAICSRLAMTADEPVCIELELQDYDCAVCIAKSSKHLEYCNETHQLWAAPRKTGSMRPGLFFTAIMDTGKFYAHPVARHGPSRIEKLLDSFVTN